MVTEILLWHLSARTDVNKNLNLTSSTAILSQENGETVLFSVELSHMATYSIGKEKFITNMSSEYQHLFIRGGILNFRD
jgi:hypothetical protein